MRHLKALYSVYFAGLGGYALFINLYLNKQLGLTTTLIGTLSGIAGVLQLIAQPLWCRRADRAGKKRTLIPVLIASVIALTTYAAASDFRQAVVAACLTACSLCAIIPIMDSFTLSALRGSGSGLSFADIRLWGSGAFALTAAAMGYFYMRVNNLRYIFAFFAASLVLLALLLSTGKGTPGHADKGEAEADPRAEREVSPESSIWKSRTARLLFASCLLNQLATVSGAAYMGIFASKLGGSYSQVGMMSTLTALVEVPTGLLLGKVIKRVGTARVLGAVFALNAVRWYLVSATTNASSLYAIQMLGGVVFIAYYTSAVTLVDGLSPAKGKSSGQSAFWIATSGLTSLLGTPAGGALFDAIGPAAFYRVVAIVASGALVLWLPQVKRASNGG